MWSVIFLSTTYSLLIRLAGVSWALVYLLIVSKKRCLPPHKHPGLRSRGCFDGRQTLRLPEQFTAAGSRKRSRDLIWADGRKVSAEVKWCPRRVGGDGGTDVQLLLLPSVPKVHGERMTSDEDMRGKNEDGENIRVRWKSHMLIDSFSVCLCGSMMSWRVRWEAEKRKDPALETLDKRYDHKNMRTRKLDHSGTEVDFRLRQVKICRLEMETNTRRGGIRWKVRAAALNRWWLTSNYIQFPPQQLNNAESR